MEKWQFRQLLHRYKNNLLETQESVYNKSARALLEVSAHQQMQPDAVLESSTAHGEEEQVCYSPQLSSYPYTGKLKVQVFGAHQSYPIANADVQISKLIQGETHQLCQFVTNAQGVVDNILLQVPSAQGSLRAQNEIASAIYDVAISHPDYHTQYATAEVMQDRTSLLTAQLLANSIVEQ